MSTKSIPSSRSGPTYYEVSDASFCSTCASCATPAFSSYRPSPLAGSCFTLKGSTWGRPESQCYPMQNSRRCASGAGAWKAWVKIAQRFQNSCIR
eukprot:1197565-Pyramimonas_sp.AAC.1